MSEKRMMNTVYRKLRPICTLAKVYCSVASPFGMDAAERHSSTRGMIVHVHVKLSTVRRCTIAVSIGMRCELTGGGRNGDAACVRSSEIGISALRVNIACANREAHSFGPHGEN